MSEFKAENVRELVLILLERMRVMDESLLEIKSSLKTKVDSEIVHKIEDQIKEIQSMIDFLSDKQEEEEAKTKALHEHEEKTKANRLEWRNIILWAISVAGGLFFLLQYFF